MFFIFPSSEGLDTLQSLNIRNISGQSSLLIQKHIITADFIQTNFFIILHRRSEGHAIFNISLSPFTFPHLFLECLFNMVFAIMHVSTLKKITLQNREYSETS